MTSLAKFRVYVTDDGRYVRDGDVDAAFLKYAVGDEIPFQDEKKVDVLDEDVEPEPVKQASKPADKQVHRVPNK